MYFGWYVKYTVYHEVDIRIIARIIFFVKKRADFFCSFCYTRIFLITSPYRSFFVVIFFPFIVSPIMMSTNPKNPNQLSVERWNASFDSAVFVMSAILIFDSPDTIWVFIGATSLFSISSMSMRDMSIIVDPSPTMIHFQIPFLTIPGSNIPRIRLIIGKKYSAYLISVGSPKFTVVTEYPKYITTISMSAKTTRTIRIFLSLGFCASLARVEIIIVNN